MDRLILFVLIALLFWSCDTRRKIIDDKSVWVRVNVNWEESGIDPNGTTIYFYPEREGMDPIRLVTHAQYDSVKLYSDNYSVVVFNDKEDEHNEISFRGMHSYVTSEAYTKIKNGSNRYSRASEEDIVENPNELGLARMTNLEMTRQMVDNDERPTLSFTPKNKICIVKIKVHVKGLENASNVTSASEGILSGLARAINLSKETPVHETATQMFTMSDRTYVPGTDNKDGAMYITFSAFGLAETAPGAEKVRNMITLCFALRNGNLLELEPRDVTDLIVKSEEEVGGGSAGLNIITFNLEIGLGVEGDPVIELPEVEQGSDDSGFNATVPGWGEEIPIDVPM